MMAKAPTVICQDLAIRAANKRSAANVEALLGEGTDELVVTVEPDKHELFAQLWACAAHDLRQPVQAALLLSKMLDGASARPDLIRNTRHVGASLESLSGMLEILNLLSRIEAGLQVVTLRKCQLAEVLQATMREMADTASKRGVHLRCQRMRGLVWSHPALLAIASKSLLLNAIKFGDGEDIHVFCRRRGSQLWLEVHCGGPSLDAAMERNAFVQLPPRGGDLTSTELGLGLALLRHLCRQLGHDLHQTMSPQGRQVLAFILPSLTVSR
jgi:signal transduction histidine kinase